MPDQLHQFKADFFKALAHPLRIQILEQLATGEKSVNEIQSLIGKEGSAVSQQLTVLRAKNIVVGTKHGNRVIYSLRDPMLIELLQVAKKIINNHLASTMNLMNQMKIENET